MEKGKYEGTTAHFNLGSYNNVMKTQVMESFAAKKPANMKKELSAIQQRMKKVNLVMSTKETSTEKSIAASDFSNPGKGTFNGQKQNQNRSNSLSLGDVPA